MNRLIKRILCLLLFSCAAVFLLEICARQLWKSRYQSWLSSGANSFGFIDKKLSLERYKPGYQITVERLLTELKNASKRIGYENTIKEVEELDIDKNSIAFEINKFGFKGPAINLIPAKGSIRILAIGDSCTFGPYIDSLSYPRQLEKALNQWEPHKFEVINAGHLGYNLEQVNRILNEWLFIKPDIIIIYLGWNRTILRADPRKNDYLYDKSAAYRLFYHSVMNRADKGGVKNVFTGKFDYQDPEIEKIRAKNFIVDLRYLKKIIDKVQKTISNPKIIVMTLAGLYSIAHQPSKEDINKGYATAFSSNLAAWPVLAYKFNEELRKFAFENGLFLLDLEKQADDLFFPRGDFFIDSVHPSPLGYKRIAEFIAEYLKKEIFRWSKIVTPISPT